MSSFTDAVFDPCYLPNGKRETWEGRPVSEARNGFYYELGFKGSGLRVYVPAGWKTDFASRPTWRTPGLLPKIAAVFVGIVPNHIWDDGAPAFVIHDLLREDERFTLLESDAILLMALEARKIEPFWRDVIFKAVRSNGDRNKHNGGLNAELRLSLFGPRVGIGS